MPVGRAGRWGLGRIAGGVAARKGALGLGGEEFALRVIGEQCRDCSRSVRTGSRFGAEFRKPNNNSRTCDRSPLLIRGNKQASNG